MQEIADWLRKLGMSEYAQRFAENGIDENSSSVAHRNFPLRVQRTVGWTDGRCVTCALQSGRI